jgi:hypothetical protein
MEGSHGRVHRGRFAFLSCSSSRSSQPSWTATSPVGHPCRCVLRHHVRRKVEKAVTVNAAVAAWIVSVRDLAQETPEAAALGVLSAERLRCWSAVLRKG